MGRPQRPLDVTKPLHAFANELRKLRTAAGEPKYLAMARKVGDVSRTALAEAAGGDHLPTWHTVEKFVLACGDDPNNWRRRWEELRDRLADRGDEPAVETPEPDSDHLTAKPQTNGVLVSRRRLWLAFAVTVPILVAIVAIPLVAGEHAADRSSHVPLPQEPIPTGPAVIIQNMMALGNDALIEDPIPAYLSSKPVPVCRLKGCMIADSVLKSGITVVATCHVDGGWMTNYNLDSSESKDNPNRTDSSLWYRLILPDGRTGFLSEVYVAPQSRGGLGLPTCSPDVPVSTPSPAS